MLEVPKTARGRATRARIMSAASELIRERGVAETHLDDVIERAGASKSQLYHYFDDRTEMLRAVTAHITDTALSDQAPLIDSLDSWKGIRAWFDALVELQRNRQALGGCAIGSLVPQLAETDEQARRVLVDAFERWEAHLREGLRSMQGQGKVDPRADPSVLATATMSSMQGGFVLTQVKRDPRQLAIALDAAYAHLRAHR